MKYTVILNEKWGFTLTFHANCFLISAVSENLPQASGELDKAALWSPILLTSLTTLLPSRLRNWSGYEIKSRTSIWCERAQKKQIIRTQLRNCISHSNPHIQLPICEHSYKFNLFMVLKGSQNPSKDARATLLGQTVIFGFANGQRERQAWTSSNTAS